MPPLSALSSDMSPAQLQEGVARLSRGGFFREASLDVPLSLLTEAAGQMCGVKRTSIMSLTNQRQELRCLELYELSRRRHSSGGTLRVEYYPLYFQALTNEGSNDADRPYMQPSTSE